MSQTQTQQGRPGQGRPGQGRPGQRSDDRPRRRREPKPEAPWIPKTILGKKVNSGEITSLL